MSDLQGKAAMYRAYIEMIRQHQTEAKKAMNALRNKLGEAPMA